MSTIQEIQDALRQLSSEDLATFRQWYAEFDVALWDRQLEMDVALLLQAGFPKTAELVHRLVEGVELVDTLAPESLARKMFHLRRP